MNLKKLAITLCFVLIIFSFAGCFESKISVSVETEPNQIVTTGENKIFVSDADERTLYHISVLPSLVGNTNEELTTYKDEDLVIYLYITNNIYSKEGFDKNNVTLSINGVELTPVHKFDYLDSYEMQFTNVKSSVNIVLTVGGIEF